MKEESVSRVNNQEAELMQEQLSLKQALDRFGMRLVDDFYKVIEWDDIVEVYTTEYIQIYRNIDFFDLCSYTLWDLLTHSWFELYERPKQTHEQLFQFTQALMLKCQGTTKYELPDHVARERLPGHRRGFQAKMRYASALINPSTNESIGFVSLMKARLVPPSILETMDVL